MAVVSFLIRLWVIHETPARPVSDFWSYQERARNLLHANRYEALPGKLDASYPPGYALVLAGVFAIVPGPETAWAGQVLNCFLGGLSTLLAGLLGRRLAGPAAGLLAAAGHALFPRAVLMAAVLASENLFTPLLLAWALALMSEKRAASSAAVFGVLSGLLALTRSVAYPASGLWVLRLILRRDFSRTALKHTLLVLCLQHAVLLPWGVRNAVSLGSFSLLTSTSGINLFIGNSPDATGAWYDWRPALERLDPGAGDPGIGPIEVDQRARAAAVRWITDHPAATIRIYAHKLGVIFSREWFLLEFAVTGKGISPPWPAIDVLPAGHPTLERARWIGLLLDWSYPLLLAAGIVSLLLAPWLPFRREALLLVTSAAFFPLVSAVYLASSRFRWPTEDLLIPLVGAVAIWCAGKIRERALQK